jgi:hypothetical protein
MEYIGEDPPLQEDIDYYGLLYACQRTHGDFALYSLRYGYAARGRTGTSPLYWNRNALKFSFYPNDGSMRDFPPGHLYIFSEDRLVCWDHMYYDKPLSGGSEQKTHEILSEIVKGLEPKIDAILFSATAGSIVASSFLKGNFPAYTAGETNVTHDNHTCVGCSDISEFARFLKENTEHRKFMCGLGFSELLMDGKKKRHTHESPFVREFAKFGLEVYSPFCDYRIINYIMDMTTPDERKNLLRMINETI